jgi:hypothetical protein
VLTDEKLDEISARLKYIRWKSIRGLAQETGGIKEVSTNCHKTPEGKYLKCKLFLQGWQGNVRHN